MNKPVGPLKPEAEVTPDPLAKLREPFPPNQISKLPKESKAQIEERKQNRNAINCQLCGSYHHKNAVHLDYVGHAALTDRLLDTDPRWSWGPMGFTPDGLPALDRNGGLWIKLTVCDMTRIGYGSADGKSGGDAMKELIGDALRNAAMRFGAALDLWHKGDLHAEEPEGERTASAEETAIAMLRAVAVSRPHFKEAWEKNKDGWKAVLDAPAWARVVAVMRELAAQIPEEPKPAAPPLINQEETGRTLADDLTLDDEIPF